MSGHQEYHMVERYRLDTWAFFAIMAMITHI